MGFLDELPDKRLLPTQKNALAKACSKFGFSADEFEWAEEDMWEHHLNYTNSEGRVYERFDRQYRVSVLKQKRSGYYCKFGPITLEYSPAKRTMTDKRVFSKDSERLAIFRDWLRLLKREDVPDLWGSLLQAIMLPKAASSSALDNHPFTPDEQNVIAAKLDEIKAFLVEGEQFNTAQAEYINREFEYLKESSRRFGRKDWLRVLLGVLIGQAINLALSPEKARGFLQVAGVAFQWVSGTVHRLLQ
jgi:hypothetical protein